MKIFEELGQDGYMDYKVEIGGEILCFPSKAELEKFLFQLYMEWLLKMLRSQQLQEAFEWLWQERQEELLLLKEKEYFSIFLGLILPLDQYFYGLPAGLTIAFYFQQIARDWMEMALNITLTTNRLVPLPVPQSPAPKM